jgi:tetratricopeptide (TPR) repeat protein
MSESSVPLASRTTLALLSAALLAACGSATQSAHHAGPAPASEASAAASPARPLVEAAEAASRSLTRAGVDSALVLLRRAVEADPRYEPAVDNLVWMHWFRGTRFGDLPAAYDSAAAHAERLRELNPVRGWYALGRVDWARGEHRFAEDALHRALALDPDYLPAYLYLGNLYFDLGRHAEGVPLQRRAAAADPRSRHARNLLGFSYFHLGLPELAVRPFEEATALQRDQFNLGGQLMIRLMRGDHADAIAYTDSVWRLDPEPAYTWARLGEAHFMAGNAAEAERFYSGALARDSASTNLYTWKSTALPLAYLYVKSGRTAEAGPLIARSYAHAEQLLRIGQEPWNAYYQFAALALLRGDRAGAIRWLRATHLAGMPGPVLIERDPLLADLRGDPEFTEIVRRLEWRAAEQRRRLEEAERVGSTTHRLPLMP